MQVILEKARAIRLAIFDVDGVLTTGALHFGPQATEYKTFHVHDGLGMQLLLKSGVQIAIITSRQSDIVQTRMQDLGIEHVYQGQKNKTAAYLELKKKFNLTDTEIAYVGDDLPDLTLIRRAGLGIAVANAAAIVCQHADWTTAKAGGKGAVREVCELIMRAQNTFDSAMQTYLT